MADVILVYQSGIQRRIFTNVQVMGDWNNWSPVAMTEFTAEDGCPAFRAVVNISDSRINSIIKWGVRADTPASNDVWIIPTEVKHPEMRDRHREFLLRHDGQYEVYRLNLSRYLGANKCTHDGQEFTKFAVWGPSAQNIEVVFGSLWDRDAHSVIPYDVNLAASPLPVGRIAGGYISDSGIGIHPARPVLPMTKNASDDVWQSDELNPALPFNQYDHRLYMYRVTRPDGSQHYCTDIYSRCQVGFGKENPGGRTYLGLTKDLDGGVSCSAIVDPDRVTEFFEEDVFPERHFIDAADFWNDEFPFGNHVPNRLEELVIYELHVGALGFGKAGPGTIKDALEFLDYLQDLGINTIELLPMAEFGGGGENWGYATSHYFAVEYAGGGRDKFKFFIRECHRRGIAVIMDVVFNHYVHNADRAQWQFDSREHGKNCYYWYEGHPDQYHEFNRSVPSERRGTGGYVDNESTAWAPRYHEEQIRQMFISSMIALVEEFHVDGFRVDQTTSIHAYNKLHANGNVVSNANAFGTKLLREMVCTLTLIKPDVILTAEDHSNDLGFVVRPVNKGGLGFDAAWYSNFYHNLIGDTNQGDKARLLREIAFGDDREVSVDAVAGALSSTGHGRIVYHESHDEAGNGSGTSRTIRVAVNGAPLLGETRLYAEARSRVVAGLSILSAGTPMFLFGEEVGAENDFRYNRVLEEREDLWGLRRGTGKNVFTFYRELIRLRLSQAGFKSRNLEVVYTHRKNRILAFRRWSDGDQLLVVASLNNAPFNQPNYCLDTPLIPRQRWRETFNSDSRYFGGSDVGNGGSELIADGNGFACIIPANGFVVFRRES